MNRLITLLLLALLLTACQPATPSVTPSPTPPPTPAPTATLQPRPTPTSATTEKIATRQPQLYGVWYNPQYDLYMEFTGAVTGTGMFKIYLGLGQLVASGNFSFADGNLLWQKSAICNDAPATYEITLISHDGAVSAMRPRLIGDDACTDRKFSTDGLIFKRVRP
jgi:hypothetical protein